MYLPNYYIKQLNIMIILLAKQENKKAPPSTHI